MLPAAGTCRAQGFKAGFWGAYGLVSMSEINRLLTDSFGNLAAVYTLRGSTLDSINTCTLNGFDAGYEFYPGLVFGARLAQLKTAEGGVAGTITANPVTGRTGSFRLAVSSSLTPFMVGGTYTVPLSRHFSLVGAVYLGYALGSATVTYNDFGAHLFGNAFPFSGANPPSTFAGSGIADDVSGELRWVLTEHLSLGLDLHFFKASITETSNVPAQQTAPDTSGGLGSFTNSSLVFDYSNIAAGVSLNFSF